MALYEMRTYTLYVGKMAEATKLYQELGFPALKKGGHDNKLIGYFQGDTGTINQLVHLWKFDDDADRRKHWAGVFANKDFVEGFASKFRPLVMSQEVKLLTAARRGVRIPDLVGRPKQPSLVSGDGCDVFVDALDLATHFLTKTLPKVAAEMVLSVRRLTDTAEKNLPTYFAGLEYDGSRPI